jgi:putative ABC transport system substrate-binding protein
MKMTTCALLVFLCTFCKGAEAQQPDKIPRVGFLTTSISSTTDRVDAFRQGLRELGYSEGKNIIIEFRSAEGKLDRLPSLVTELMRLRVEAIVSGGGTVTRIAKEATATIPIIMTQDNDPVGNGFIVSLARPGGNVTGLSRLSPETSGKRLELLKEIIPNLSRLAVFGTSKSPSNAKEFTEVEATARVLAMKLQYLDVLGSQDIEPAFRAAAKGRAEAGLIMMSNAVTNFQHKRTVELAIKNRLPVIHETSQPVEVGGLISYGVSLTDLDRRAAIYVDKILKGAKPADLPVEQPTKFELVINLKTAKQIGLVIPPNVLARADRVIR